MKILFFTHCYAKKDDSLKGTGRRVTPLELYKATPTQRFMRRCIKTKVNWAIFSDKHAFVFPNEKIEWYEKPPNTLTGAEKEELFNRAYSVLKNYGLTFFYFNPGRFHPAYRDLLEDMKRRGINMHACMHACMHAHLERFTRQGDVS